MNLPYPREDNVPSSRRGDSASRGCRRRPAIGAAETESTAFYLLIAAQQPDQPALHLDPVGTEDPRLIGLVGGLECDRGAAPAQPLQGYFLIVDQRDDNGA